MPLTEQARNALLSQLDSLIASGSSIPMKAHKKRTSLSMITGQQTYRSYDLASWPEFVEWRTSCTALLDQAVPKTSALRKTVDSLDQIGNKPTEVQFISAFLRSIKTQIEGGSLDTLASRVEAAVLGDYLDQAFRLIEGKGGSPEIVAAAVLAGATLERHLRAICDALNPPEPTADPDGDPFNLSALIDRLKARQAYDELQAKQLRSWAGVRNSAAHGKFEELKKRQVEAMVKGVADFLAEGT